MSPHFVCIQIAAMSFCLFSDLELQYVLDAKKEQRKRMFFMAEEGRSRRKKTITMLKGREFKESFTVYLSPAGVKDKLTSLDVQVGHIHRCPSALVG